MRHKTSSAVAYKLKSGNKHMNRFKAIVSAPEFSQELENARAAPTGAAAKRLLRVLLPLVRSTSSNVKYSAGERAAELSTMYSISHRYGLPSDFITFSQSSAREPLVIKFGLRQFGHGEMEWNSSTHAARTIIANNNPAACAGNFDKVSRAVLVALFGVTPRGERGDSRKEVLRQKK